MALAQWLRKKVSKIFGAGALKAVEDVPIPERFPDFIALFEESYPHATRTQWAEMANELARDAYALGFSSGATAAFVTDSGKPWDSEVSPEEFADVAAPGWRKSAPVNLHNPDAIVLEEEPSDSVLTDDMIKRFAREPPEGVE